MLELVCQNRCHVIFVVVSGDIVVDDNWFIFIPFFVIFDREIIQIDIIDDIYIDGMTFPFIFIGYLNAFTILVFVVIVTPSSIETIRCTIFYLTFYIIDAFIKCRVYVVDLI